MTGHPTRCGILVLGGGPAGAAAALGLRRLGHDVMVVGDFRPFRAVEGISERAVAALRGAGFERFVAALPEPSPRRVTWNGVSSAANTERLIRRADFDTSLWQDLASAGVAALRGRVRGCVARDDGFLCDIDTPAGSTHIEAGFLVEARGRAAPSATAERLRGPETLALLHYRRGTPGPARSAVQSHADGWAWMASDTDGQRYLQLTFDASALRLPPKNALGAFCETRLAELESARTFIACSEPVGTIRARTSTSILCLEPVGRNWIRIGDAAMAVDPLSGNGIFQSLSSALQAPAVINTLMRRPDAAALAAQFHRERIRGLFLRFARIGRDFCRLETQWAERPFWSRRRHWPDVEPAHPVVTPADVTIVDMPVANLGFIEAAEVVVSPEHPLGVWHLRGHAAAPLLRAARQSQHDPGPALARLLGPDAARAPQVLAWMRERGWIHAPSA
ncbi:flavin-dependent monooxygenase QhpG [Rhodocyclaceae bacterium SMB388]